MKQTGVKINWFKFIQTRKCRSDRLISFVERQKKLYLSLLSSSLRLIINPIFILTWSGSQNYFDNFVTGVMFRTCWTSPSARNGKGRRLYDVLGTVGAQDVASGWFQSEISISSSCTVPALAQNDTWPSGVVVAFHTNLTKFNWLQLFSLLLSCDILGYTKQHDQNQTRLVSYKQPRLRPSWWFHLRQVLALLPPYSNFERHQSVDFCAA